MAWFINRKIATKITICFGTVLAIGLVVGVLMFQSLMQIQATAKWTTHTQEVLREARKMTQILLNEATSAPALRIGSAQDRSAPHDSANTALGSELQHLLDLTRDNATQQSRLAELKQLVDARQTQLAADVAAPAADKGAVLMRDDQRLAGLAAKLGDVFAEEERLYGIRAKAGQSAFNWGVAVSGTGPLVALLAAILFGIALHGVIARPLARLTAATRELADGNTSVRIPAQNRTDEIGALSSALLVFRNAIEDAKRLREEQGAGRRRAEADRAALTAAMADRFEAVVGGIVQAVSTSAADMHKSAASLLSLAEWTTVEVKTVAATTKSASMTMRDIVGETRQLSDSVGEINMRVAYSADVAHQAVAEADRTTGSVEGLSNTARRIGAIVDLINDVARQTNLLALNATIEAARAGEAGRGFAVVASEVKALADQTSKATEDIRAQIGAMQAAATDSVAAIGGISRTIAEMARVTGEVAQAVETQGSSTRDMMRGTVTAAEHTADVAHQLEKVSEGAVTTGAAATNVLAAAKALAQQSTVLHDESRRFVASVRAG